MERRRSPAVLICLSFLAVFVLGCSGAPSIMLTEEPQTTESALDEREAVMPTPAPTPSPADGGGPLSPVGGRALPAVQPRPNRLIIKNAEMELLVSDTDHALDLTTQVVGDVGGYILSSRVWYESWLDEPYKYAALTMGVPVDQFETALRRLRGIATQVVDETASGQDVTDEYVDLESRLRNLEVTRDRIRAFLDQAVTVEEALRVNEQLKVVEAEVEQVQGRMNYLFDRAGYSTIAVRLTPDLPPIPTPTPVPEPPPTVWSASEIAEDAGATLTAIVRALAEVGIWLAVVVAPLAIPPVAVVFIVRAAMQRRNRPPEDAQA